jgi:two-component system, cell cycle response regulator DivK
VIEQPRSVTEHRRARVLVIEDNEQNLYLTTFILERHGYEVIQAREGREGIEAASQVHPDLILLDIQLPKMDGYQVATMLRANPDLTDVPIIAVTSYAMVGDRERVLASGCTGYIEKPINPDTFVAQVTAHLPGDVAGKGWTP